MLVRFVATSVDMYSVKARTFLELDVQFES